MTASSKYEKLFHKYRRDAKAAPTITSKGTKILVEHEISHLNLQRWWESQEQEWNHILRTAEVFSREAPLLHGSDYLGYFHHPTKSTGLMNRRHNKNTETKPINQYHMISRR